MELRRQRLPLATSTFYDWIFDDGNTGSGVTTSHQYGKRRQLHGDAHGPQHDIRRQRQYHADHHSVVAGPPPVSTANSPGNNLRWNFNASGSSGQIDTYAWKFGDGTTGSGATTTHDYGSGGSYIVELTVSNTTDSHSTTQTLSVSHAAHSADSQLQLQRQRL